MSVRLHQRHDILQDLAIAHGRRILGQAGDQLIHLVDHVADKQKCTLQILLIALGNHLVDQRQQLILLERKVLQGRELLDDGAKLPHVIRAANHTGEMPLYLLQQRRHIVHQILMQPVDSLL